MPDPDKKFVNPDEDAEEASVSFNTEDDAPRDDEPPPKDQGEN